MDEALGRTCKHLIELPVEEYALGSPDPVAISTAFRCGITHRAVGPDEYPCGPPGRAASRDRPCLPGRVCYEEP